MIKGFITNLGKYNEGELIGEWIEFPIDDDELQEVFERIGISDEPTEDGVYYEEYFFTDWDCEIECNFGEYESIRNVNDFAEGLEAWEGEEDKLKAVCEIWSLEEAVEDGPNGWHLYSDIEDDEDLGYYWVEESGCYDTKSLGRLANYIDYEAFGRDIRFEVDGGHTDYGWVERE